MRRLVGFLVFVALVIVVIGIWRGWFTVLFNQGRFQHDEQRVERKLDQGTEKLKEDLHPGTQKVEQKTGN